MRKMLIAASMIIVFAALGIGGALFYNTPVNYVSFDINPSVELGLNAFDTVVSAQGVNEDGKNLLVDGNLYQYSLQNAMSYLVQQAAEQGYISEDGSTVIAVTALCNNEQKAIELQNSGEQGIKIALQTKNKEAVVYAAQAGLEIRTKAQEMGVSPGKYRLIQVLEALDPGINPEQYKGAKITDIIAKAGQLLGTSNMTAQQFGGYAGTLEKIDGVARQIQSGGSGQGSSAGQGSGSASMAEQEANQNSGTSSNQEQEQNKNQYSGTASQASGGSSGAGSSGSGSYGSGSGGKR